MANSAVYLVTAKAAAPLSVANFKLYAKQDSADDDALIQDIINAVTAFGERYTGRDFRAVTYRLLLDELGQRVCIQRSLLDTITSVKHLVAGVYVAISSSLYYLKTELTHSDIILKDDQIWPTDTDDVEQAFEIIFVTKANLNYADEVLQAIKQHALFMYMNRGDSDDLMEGAKLSGAAKIYNQFRIQRL